MADLLFDLRGYLFQKGLKDIRYAYEATITALEALHANAQSDMRRLRAAIATGEVMSVRYDDNGERLYDQEDLHAMLIDEAASAVHIACGSYIIVLYHHWEKHCKMWLGIKSYRAEKHADKIYKWLEEQGVCVDRAALDDLRKTANTIKHDAELPPDQLSKHYIENMFETVRRSGLRASCDLPVLFSSTVQNSRNLGQAQRAVIAELLREGVSSGRAVVNGTARRGVNWR